MNFRNSSYLNNIVASWKMICKAPIDEIVSLSLQRNTRRRKMGQESEIARQFDGNVIWARLKKSLLIGRSFALTALVLTLPAAGMEQDAVSTVQSIAASSASARSTRAYTG